MIYWTDFPYCCSGTFTGQSCVLSVVVDSAVRQHTTCLELSWIQLWFLPSREVQLEFIHLFWPFCGVYWEIRLWFYFMAFLALVAQRYIFFVLLVIFVLFWGLQFVFVKLIEVGKFAASSDWQMFMFKNMWLVLHALAQFLLFWLMRSCVIHSSRVGFVRGSVYPVCFSFRETEQNVWFNIHGLQGLCKTRD